jgi:hypothetical protein
MTLEAYVIVNGYQAKALLDIGTMGEILIVRDMRITKPVTQESVHT